MAGVRDRLLLFASSLIVLVQFPPSSADLGANAVVVADRERVTAYALAGGGQFWSVDLPAAPVPWGMATNRHGQTLVTLVDGRIVCLGE